MTNLNSISPFKLILLSFLLSFFVYFGNFTDTALHAIASPAARGPVPPSSSLARLVDLAEERSPVLAELKLKISQSELELANAKAKYWPSLDLSAVHGVQDSAPRTESSPWASSLALTLSESFYDNGVRSNRKRLAESRLERRRFEYLHGRDLHLLSIAQNYFAWSSIAEQRVLNAEKLTVIKRQFAALEHQYKQGLRTRRDLIRLETEIRRLEILQTQSANDLELAQQRLTSSLGFPHSEPPALALKPETAKSEIPSFVPKALSLDGHRKTAILRLTESELGHDTLIAEGELGPRIEIAGQVSSRHSDYLGRRPINESQSWNWSALVTLNYNLWDRGTRRRSVELSRINEQILKQQNSQSLLNLDVELREVDLRLREQIQTIRLALDLLKLERQSFNNIETDYRNGQTSYLDLITNLNSLTDARSKFIAAYFDYRSRQAVYHFHGGDLVEYLKAQ